MCRRADCAYADTGPTWPTRYGYPYAMLPMSPACCVRALDGDTLGAALVNAAPYTHATWFAWPRSTAPIAPSTETAGDAPPLWSEYENRGDRPWYRWSSKPPVPTRM